MAKDNTGSSLTMSSGYGSLLAATVTIASNFSGSRFGKKQMRWASWVTLPFVRGIISCSSTTVLTASFYVGIQAPLPFLIGAMNLIV
jgi:hypothetical protein